ncbi:glycosyltransferase family 9 protein [bacterium]|nr:glycosyltransferase family 9 protein [bacterium]
MPVEILIRLTALGDVLLAVPTARALAQNGAEVHWVLSSKWAEISPFLPATRVHTLNGISDLPFLSRRLRALKPIKTYDLQGKVISNLLALFLGAPSKYYSKRSLRESFRIALGRYPLECSPNPVWKRYLNTIGNPDQLPDARLTIPENYLAYCKKWLSESIPYRPENLVLFHPGASKPGKVLPPEACQKIIPSQNFPVALIGDKVIPISFSPTVDLRGKIPLSILPGFMALSRGVISTDSGPMHLARAMDCRLVGIFVQAHPNFGFSPIPSSKTKIISGNLSCQPCSPHGERSACPKGDWECRNLNWKAISEDIKDFLNQ